MQTPAEVEAWEILRGRRLLGLKFRRQQPIGPYIVDFFCPERGVVVEIDGAVHDGVEAEATDVERDAYLQARSLTVVRVRNSSVSRDTLVRRIAACLPALLSIDGEGDGGEV